MKVSKQVEDSVSEAISSLRNALDVLDEFDY